MATKVEMLQFVFKELEEDIIVNEVALISSDGLLMAGSFKSSSNLDIFCAMIALIMRSGKKVSNELGKRNLDKLFLKLQDGSIIACEVNVNSIIAIMVPEEENIGLIFNRLDKAKEKIRKILE